MPVRMRDSRVPYGFSTLLVTGSPCFAELANCPAESAGNVTNSTSISVSGLPSSGTPTVVRAGFTAVFPNLSVQADSQPA